MAKKSYAEKLKYPRWQKKRLQVLERDMWCCRLCNDAETTLNVHHLSYHGEPWDASDNELMTLCEHCHKEIEDLRNDDSFPNHTAMDFEVFKCDGWRNGHRIMFFKSNISGIVSMVIYDSKTNWVCGFNFGKSTLEDIQSLLSNG